MLQQTKQALIFPFILVFVEIITYLSTDMYLPALPMLAEQFKVSQSLAQYTQTFWFLGSASIQLLIGPLAIKYGRKFVMLIGIIIFMFASFLCAFTSDIGWFLAARFFQGTTVCVVIVAGYATIHDLYSGKKAVQILAAMGSITILAPALGPTLGALIIAAKNWQMIFWILTFGALLGTLGIYLFMPNNNTSCLEQQIVQKFNIRNLANDYKNILLNKNFIRITLINCFVIICFFIWIVESPFIIVNTYHQSQLYFGFIQFVVFAGFILGAQISKRLVVNKTAKQLCDRGMLVLGTGLIIFIAFAYYQLSMNLIITGMVLLATGAAMVSGILNRMAIESVTQPMEHRVAIFSTLISISAFFASYMVTYIVNVNFYSIALLMAGFIFSAQLIYFTIRSNLQLKNN